MDTPLAMSFRDVFKSTKALKEERAAITRKIAEKQRKLGSILQGDAHQTKDGSGSKADKKVHVVPPKDNPGSNSNSNQTRPNGTSGGKQSAGDYLSKKQTDASSNGAPSIQKTIYVDENLTLEELILLNNLATKYEEEKWIRISSRFYDKTGKRVTAEKVKSYVERGHS